jgi:hypothetical protein
MKLKLIQVDSYGVFDLFHHLISSAALAEKRRNFIGLGIIQKKQKSLMVRTISYYITCKN